MTSVREEKDLHPIHDREEVSFSHIFEVFSRYLPVIGVSLAAVLFLYALLCVALVITAPVQRTTSMTFRLSFGGADRQAYPNGLPFNAVDIVAAPTLRRVYEANDLQRFVGFPKFKNSIFILESNPAIDNIDRQYEAALADPKLSAVDRQRLESEYALKRASVSHSQFSLNYAAMDHGNMQIPSALVEKSLSDTLQLWADDQLKNKGALRYRISTRSSGSLNATATETAELILALEMLRTKINAAVAALDDLLRVPGAEVVRVPGSNLSAADVRAQLQDLIRFRINPFELTLLSQGLISKRAPVIQFLESQKVFFERELNRARARVDAIREGLMIYAGSELSKPSPPLQPAEGGERTQPSGSSETVMAQLSDTFLDRLVRLSSESADRVYRQERVDELRRAMIETAPLEQEVAYYDGMARRVDSMRNTRPPSASELAAWNLQLKEITKDFVGALKMLDAVSEQLSETQSSSAGMYTVTGPPVGRVERTISLKTLALNGLLTILVALPVILLLCFVHNRVRQENVETRLTSAQAPPGAPDELTSTP